MRASRGIGRRFSRPPRKECVSMRGSGFGASATSPNTSPGSSLGRALLLAVLALASAGRVFAEDRESLPALIERFDHLGVGKAMLVGPLTLSSGHIECKLQ